MTERATTERAKESAGEVCGLGLLWGGTERGAALGEGRRRKHRTSERSERGGAQRGARVKRGGAFPRFLIERQSNRNRVKVPPGRAHKPPQPTAVLTRYARCAPHPSRGAVSRRDVRRRAPVRCPTSTTRRRYSNTIDASPGSTVTSAPTGNATIAVVYLQPSPNTTDARDWTVRPTRRRVRDGRPVGGDEDSSPGGPDCRV